MKQFNKSETTRSSISSLGNRFAQSGRSMLEVIAVIILLALLLIAGLYGFRQAILNSRVNTMGKDLANAVTDRRYLNSQGGAGKDHFVENTIVGNTKMQIKNQVSAGTFFVSIKNIKPEECEEMKKFNIFKAKGFGKNGDESSYTEDPNTIDCTQISALDFYFDNYGSESAGGSSLGNDCDGVSVKKRCDIEKPNYDSKGCVTETPFSCGANEHCENENLCCENDETASECATTPQTTPSATPGCSDYIKYTGTCACNAGEVENGTCTDDQNEDSSYQLTPTIKCTKCLPKTCTDKGWQDTNTCGEGFKPEERTYTYGTCYECVKDTTTTCPVCQKPEIASPTGCNADSTKNNEDVGGTNSCGYCLNGQVKPKDNENCRKCVKKSDTEYLWKDKTLEESKDTETGKCCVNGEFGYHEGVCPEPKADTCEVAFYSQKYSKNNNKQTADTKVEKCCTKDKLTTFHSDSTLIDSEAQGYLWEGNSTKYYCCKGVTYGTKVNTGIKDPKQVYNSCCPTERAYTNDKNVTTCCASGKLATDIGCCDANRTYEENGIKKCCGLSDTKRTVMCGQTCCSYCDVSGNSCGDCEAPLYTKPYNKKPQQTETAGCCTNDRLIAGSTNAEFNGFKWGETTRSYCCPEGYEILGDKTKSSSKCCDPNMVYTDTKGVKQCCTTADASPYANQCCLKARQYEDKDGNEKCCTVNLVRSVDGTMVCPNLKECHPLSISTKVIGKTKKIKNCWTNDEQTEWEDCGKANNWDIYSISYNGTITPIYDITLHFDIMGILDMSETNFFDSKTLDPHFVQKIYVKEVGGGTLVNKSGLNDFENCNKIGPIKYKYSCGMYGCKEDYIASKEFKQDVTLKAGKTYEIDIDIKNYCESCVVNSSCSVYKD